MSLANSWLDRTGITIAGRPNTEESFYSDNNVKVVNDELVIDGKVVAKFNENKGITSVTPVKEIAYDEAKNELRLKSEVDGVESDYSVSLTDLQDEYKVGNGLNMGDDKVISIKMDDTTEPYISVTDKGIAISGINSVIDQLRTELKTEISDMKTELITELNKIPKTYNEEWYNKVEDFVVNHPHDMGKSPFPTDTYGATHPSA